MILKHSDSLLHVSIPNLSLGAAAVMSFQRRRYPYYNRLRRLLPLVFAVSLSLLVLFAFLSFLAPHPGDSDRLPPRVRHTSVLSLSLSRSINLSPFDPFWYDVVFLLKQINIGGGSGSDSIKSAAFRVPVSGFILLPLKFKAFDFVKNGLDLVCVFTERWRQIRSWCLAFTKRWVLLRMQQC